MNDEIFRGLIRVALWTNEDSLREDLKNEDYNFTQEDFSPSAISFLRNYVKEFIEAFPEFCSDPDLYRIYRWNHQEGTLLDYVGHDLWLTTCGHGAGFWDGDWAEYIGEELSEWCRKQGEIEPYLGDDGLIYIFGEENYTGEIE